MSSRKYLFSKFLRKRLFYVLMVMLRRIVSSNINLKMFIAIIDPNKMANKPNSNGPLIINDNYLFIIKVSTIVYTNMPKDLRYSVILL